MTQSNTDRLAREFNARTLPKSEWTHEAHLRVGVWHLLRFSPADALVHLRSGISEYNAATGTVNSDESGYHETLTRFYVTLLHHFLRTHDHTIPEDELADQVVQSLGDRDLPLRYYSPERLSSLEARRGWVEPDRLSLPHISPRTRCSP